jgi:hypothetical protein
MWRHIGSRQALPLGFGEDIVERDRAQIACSDHVDELPEDVCDSQVVEMIGAGSAVSPIK